MNCSAKRGKGIAWQGDGQQRKGIDKLSVAMAMRRMGMKRDAEEKQRHSSVKQSEKWQGHSIVRFSKARSGKGIARKGNGQQRKGIDKIR